MSTVRPTDQPTHSDEHTFFGPAVEAGGGLVEQQERGVPDEGSSQGNPLALPCGEAGPIVSEPGVRPFGKVGDHVVEAGRVDGGTNRVVGGVGAAETDILGDRAGEQMGSLRDPGHLCSAKRQGPSGKELSRRPGPNRSTPGRVRAER